MVELVNQKVVLYDTVLTFCLSSFSNPKRKLYWLFPKLICQPELSQSSASSLGANSSKILMIHLKRNQHLGGRRNDVDFGFQLNLSKYYF